MNEVTGSQSEYLEGYADGQSDVLDAIKAEIESQIEPGHFYYTYDRGIQDGLKKSIEIIDKYRSADGEL